MIGTLRLRLTLAALAAALIVLGLALPAGASAVESFTFAVSLTGSGSGEVECTVEEPGEEAYEEFCPETPFSYPKNTKITVVPWPEEPGSEFAGFKNGTGNATTCSGKCSPTLTQNSTVDAQFDLIMFPLTVKVTGPGHGTIECEVDESGVTEGCEPEYPYETKLVLLAEPDAESEFGEWEGCEFKAENECELSSIEEPTTVKATFNLQPLLQIGLLGSGRAEGAVECEDSESVQPEKCKARYPEEEELVLHAKAGPGAEFVGWEGCESVAGAECEVTMAGETAVKASFIAERTLTIEETGSGMIAGSPGSIHCPSACSGRFELGAKVTLTAIPATGAIFAGWAGGGCKGIGGCTVTVSGEMTVAAEFESKPPPEVEEGPLAAGIARAAASAQVKAGRAALKLSCSGGPCSGTLQLAAKVKQGHKLKSLVAGRAPFHLAAGAKKTIEVKLSGPVKQELGKGKIVKAKLSGAGVASSTVTLEPAKTRRSH